MRVAVVTYLASPYQAELFNAVAASGGIELEVVYLHRTSRTRRWTIPPISHTAVCLDEEPGRFEEVRAEILDADLAVFNYYSQRSARVLLDGRAASGKPWCFWGERPGLRKPEWIGRLVRQCALSWLHDSPAPIWGIGRFAVERYQTEFGPRRAYCNLPYFSDLKRFQCSVGAVERAAAERVFLFSGSLIHRKAVDLVGRAFLRLAREVSNVRLRLLGDGELYGALAEMLHPVRERVEFIGFKDWAELPAYYGAADILCVPSRYDGWGLVVPEGLASGLPVIGTNSMGAAIEFIKSGLNGWLVPAGHGDMLFAAMREAALLPDTKLAEMSCRARESVREHSLQHGIQRFIRATRDALANWQS